MRELSQRGDIRLGFRCNARCGFCYYQGLLDNPVENEPTTEQLRARITALRNEGATEVEFTVTRAGGSYAVRVCDRFDGEVADVFETAWDGEVLSFAAHWNKTGRFARYRILLLSANRIDVTYTYTDNEMYHRKRTKRNA